MIVSVQLPQVLPGDPVCTVRAIHAVAGGTLGIGDGVIDFSVDLGAGQAFDCPPIIHFRLALAEAGRLDRIDVSVGQEIEVGDIVAMLHTDGGDAADGEVRVARVNVASILHHDDWWEDL